MKEEHLISNYKKLKRLHSTAYTLDKYIPMPEELIYSDLWSYYYSLKESQRKEDFSDADVKEVRKIFKRYICRWLKAAPEEDIITLKTNLIYEGKMIVLKVLHEIVPRKYKGFFESEDQAFPNDFAAPTLFLVMERKTKDCFISSNQPLIRRYGNTRLKISGTVLKAEDGKLTFALLRIMRRKKTEVTKKYISFKTTLIEISKELKKSNPWAAKDAIWYGLKRLRQCHIDLRNEKGKIFSGGILDEAMELDEDSQEIVAIFLDLNFVKLFSGGYVSLDYDIYAKLRPTAANLYVFLMRQKSFKQSGRLRPWGINKIYTAAGLGGVNPNRHNLSYKRFQLKKALGILKETGIITRVFSTKNDKLSIGHKKKVIQAKKSDEVLDDMDNDDIFSLDEYEYDDDIVEVDEYNDDDDHDAEKFICDIIR